MIYMRPDDHLTSGLVDMIEYLKPYFQEKVKMVEIGCFAGESAKIIHSNLNCELYCVDPWVGGYDRRDSASGSNMELIEQRFDDAIQGTDIIKIKKSSLEASEMFEDGSLDLVYIDAEHTYKAMKQDIQLWLPKLKPTGFFTGHDYQTLFQGVMNAINESFGEPDKTFKDTSWVKKV
jgi:predicted O-methyltransferase YrrM